MSNELLWLVDDDASMAAIVQILARRKGYRLVEYRTAEEAWEALQRGDESPALVLLDVNLPGLSGADWLKRVKSTEHFRTMVIGVFSSAGMVHDIAEMFDRGADFLVCKEIVTDASIWGARIAEILQHSDSQEIRSALECSNKGVLTSRTWESLIRSLLSSPSLQTLPPEIRDVIIRRVMRECGPDHSSGLHHASPSPNQLERFIAQLQQLVRFRLNYPSDVNIR